MKLFHLIRFGRPFMPYTRNCHLLKQLTELLGGSKTILFLVVNEFHKIFFYLFDGSDIDQSLNMLRFMLLDYTDKQNPIFVCATATTNKGG